MPIAQADPATLLEAALQLREAKPALFAGALGVLIVKVVPGSQAAEKGLQPGDIVIAYAGEKMNSADQLIEVVQAKASEVQVGLRFIRREKVEEIELKSGKMGVELKNIQGLQATEFAKQLQVAIQANDYEKLHQLLRDNSEMAKQVLPPDLLAKVTKEVFLKQLQAATQVNDDEKLLQLIRDNPEMAKAVLPPDLLAELGQSIEFEKQLQVAIQAKDYEKIRQLIRDNPKLAKETLPPELLAEAQIRPELDRLQKEGEEAYYQSNYLLAIEKWQVGLDQARQSGYKRAISVFLSNLGVVYTDLYQYPKALEYHQQALSIHKELGDKRGEGNDLTNFGNVYNQSEQYPKALEYYQQALSIHKELGDKRGEGSDLGNLGMVYDELSQYLKALEYYQQALAIHRELGDERQEGNNLTNLGVVYYNLGQYPKALEYDQQALAIHRELGDKSGEGSDLTNLGVVYDNLGQYPKALEYYQQSLAIHKELGDKRGEGGDLSNIGVVYHYLGQYPKALEYYQQSLAIHKELGNKRGEGSGLTNLGIVSYHLGQYPKALEHYQQALAIVKELGDKRGEGNNLANFGNLYSQLGQYSKALEYYQQALAIHKELGDKRGEGSDLGNLGLLYQESGQYLEALEYSRQALAIHKELGDKRGEGNGLGNLGMLYGNAGQYLKALGYYQLALAIHRELGSKHGEGSALVNLGVLYHNLSLYDEAKTHFQNSISIFELLNELDGLWKAKGGLASTEVLLKQPKDAIQHYEQALDTIEQLRAGLTSDLEKHTGIQTGTLKTSFMQDKFIVYDLLINLYHDQGDDQKAFETFERKQGRAFLEDMALSGVRRYVGLPVAISQKEETLETQLEAARKIKEEAAGKGDEAFKQADERVTTAKTARDAFQAELKVNHPRYYALKHPQPVKLPDLQQNVLQEGELLLIYNVRKEATDLWLVGKQHFQMFSLPMTEAQVKKQVEEFRKWGIDRADTEDSLALADSLEKDFTDFTQASHTLYQQLFPATVRTLLGEAKPKLLYIVPTSALYELPFEALVTENTDKPHYLLQDYAISYLSSASLLKTLRDAKQRRGTAQRQPLLAFADPVYPPCSDTTTQTTSTEESLTDIQIKGYLKVMSTDCFRPLPVSGQEASAIAELLEVEEDSQPLPLQLGEDAAKSTVLQFNDKQWLDDYRYILFSTHAILPNEVSYIQQPAIVLSHQQANEDGFLTMGDVFGLSMNTDLVMLSACNTGRGETIKGEGTIGLTRAFMYAGTPAVSITLWSIEALAAKNLNVAWFTRLKAGQPLADSLREAKLEMLDKSGYYRYPYAWAGVVVFGDGK